MDGSLDTVKDHHHLHWAEDCEIIVFEETALPQTEGPSPNLGGEDDPG
jgi:hypothetical protein